MSRNETSNPNGVDRTDSAESVNTVENVNVAEQPSGVERQIIAQTVTVLNEKSVTALTRHTMKLMVFLMCCLAVSFTVLGLTMLFGGYDKTISITFIIAGVAVPLLVVVLLPVMLLKGSKKIFGLVQTISYGDAVYIKDDSQMIKSGEAEVKWEYFAKADETKDYFFIFINKFNAYVIDKSTFTIGNADVLRNLMTVKLGQKFKPYKKAQ